MKLRRFKRRIHPTRSLWTARMVRRAYASINSWAVP